MSNLQESPIQKEQVLINNLQDLLLEMTTTYQQLRNGGITLREANGRANLAGKILGCVKVQLEYNNYMKTTTPIGFLDNPKEDQLTVSVE